MKNIKITKSFVGAISGLLLLGFGTVKDNNFLSVTGLSLLGFSTLTNLESKQLSIQSETEKEEEKEQFVNIPLKPITRVYIDGANFYGTTQSLKFQVDFAKLVDTIADKDAIFKHYYAVSTPQTIQETKFINYLEEIGYLVVKCTRKSLANGEHKIKGDDIKIAVDILTEANAHDHIILVSGDGDFKYALEKAKLKGCQITVVSSADCLSKDLKNIADNLIKIEDIKNQIQRQSTEPKSSSKSKSLPRPKIVNKKAKTTPKLLPKPKFNRQKPQVLPQLKSSQCFP